MDEKYISISELNNYIKAKIDGDEGLRHVFLRGEISNFKRHTRGHLYFTLKDETSRLSAVMFASSTYSLTFAPEDGMKVLVEGRISVYEANGAYQIYAEKMEQDGIGNLYIAYEKLKKKLQEEGLFDETYKKPIPRFPKKIGIITASTGAAIRDILSTIKRRYPICETILFPSLVQGESAKEDIVRQIHRAQEYDLDVIICGRGGGSIEDLWAFNEEIVARAIFDSKIPIISAVGHEVDFTIADFVADLRAPTPTGAAEMAVPNIADLLEMTRQYRIRLKEAISNRFHHAKVHLERLKESYVLKNPLALYEVKEQKLDNLLETLQKNMEAILVKQRHRLDIGIKSLELLNPLSILEKGYSVVSYEGKIIHDASLLQQGDLIEIKMHQGKLHAIVEKEK